MNKEFYKITLKSINKCSTDIDNVMCGYCLKKI